MFNKNKKNKLLEKEIGKLALKSDFYSSIQELESKLTISDVAIDIENDNISYEFIKPINLTKSFKNIHNIESVEDIELTKSEIILDGVEFADNNNDEITTDTEYKKSIQKKVNTIEDIINDDLDQININFQKLQNKIAIYIDKIDETSKGGFINALKRFRNSKNKQRVLDNYMAVFDYNKIELMQELWRYRAILYFKSEDSFLDNIKQKIKALYHIKSTKFKLSHLKANETKIYNQIEDMIDEAYQILYLEKIEYKNDIDTVVSIKDGEIYKMIHSDAMKVFSVYGLKI